MRIFLLILVPFFIFAQSHSLKTLINHANKENELIKAKEINIKAKQKEVDAAKSAYWPTVDIGASHSMLSPNYIASPGQVSSYSNF